jgi:hypothetical protein
MGLRLISVSTVISGAIYNRAHTATNSFVAIDATVIPARVARLGVRFRF